MNAYIVHPSGEKQEVTPYPRGSDLHPKTFAIEQLEDLIGGYVKFIELTEDVSMVVGDEIEDQFLNMEATRILKKALPKYNGFISGKAIICKSTMLEEE